MTNLFKLSTAEVRFGASTYPLHGLVEEGFESFASYAEAVERMNPLIDALGFIISGLTREGVRQRLRLSYVKPVVCPDTGKVYGKPGICAMGDGFYVFWKQEG